VIWRNSRWNDSQQRCPDRTKSKFFLNKKSKGNGTQKGLKEAVKETRGMSIARLKQSLGKKKGPKKNRAIHRDRHNKREKGGRRRRRVGTRNGKREKKKCRKKSDCSEGGERQNKSGTHSRTDGGPEQEARKGLKRAGKRQFGGRRGTAGNKTHPVIGRWGRASHHPNRRSRSIKKSQPPSRNFEDREPVTTPLGTNRRSGKKPPRGKKSKICKELRLKRGGSGGSQNATRGVVFREKGGCTIGD